MTTVEPVEQEMHQHAARAVNLLDDMRTQAREVGKEVARSGVPTEFQRRAIELMAAIEDFEAGLSEYVVGVEQ